MGAESAHARRTFDTARHQGHAYAPGSNPPAPIVHTMDGAGGIEHDHSLGNRPTRKTLSGFIWVGPDHAISRVHAIGSALADPLEAEDQPKAENSLLATFSKPEAWSGRIRSPIKLIFFQNLPLRPARGPISGRLAQQFAPGLHGSLKSPGTV